MSSVTRPLEREKHQLCRTIYKYFENILEIMLFQYFFLSRKENQYDFFPVETLAMFTR